MNGIWLGAAAIAGVAVGLPALVVAIVIVSIHWTFRKWPAPLAVALVLTAALGAYRGEARPERADSEVLARSTAFRASVGERPKLRGSTQSLLLSLTSVQVGDRWVPMTGTLVVTTSIWPQIFAGDDIFFTGEAKPVDELVGDELAYVRSQSADGSAYAQRIVVDQPGSGVGYEIQRVAAGISERLQRAVPGDPGILLSGLVMGDDTRLSPERRDAFINTGTTHITAVSGSNFALLIVMLTWVGRTSGTRRRLWFQIIAVGFVWLYAALVGFGPPAVRAALVASAALLGIRFGRRPDFVTLLVLAAALDVLVRPDDVSRLSYQLSTASALTLALVLPGLNPRGVVQLAAAATLSTFAAQLATLPFLLPVFPRISIVSVLANALIALPTSLAFILAMAASMVLPVWTGGGEAVAAIAGVFAQMVIGVVDLLGSDRVTRSFPTGGGIGALWITVWCLMAIVLMSGEMRNSATVIGNRFVRSNWTVALALAGAIGGVILGVLAWSLH